MKRSSFLWLAGCLLLGQNVFATEIDTCTVQADSTTFFSQHLNRTLPVHNLNEILLLSVATQSMHGADKTGMVYLIDGVDVSKLMYKNGAVADPYSLVNRNGNSLGTPTGKWDATTSGVYINGRQVDMPHTAIQITEREIATANVHAGTIPASYAASGGIVNLTTRNGGDKLTASLNLRSNIGHLNHMGPDLYNNNPDHNPDYCDGKNIAQIYQERRDYLVSGDEWDKLVAETMTWYPGKYNYGDKPRINGDFTLGGSLGKKLKFFLAADVLNDYGTLPAQFQRQIGASLKLNYQPSSKNQFTLYGKLSDQGKIGGWVNRSFSYTYMFNPEYNPVHQGLGLMSYFRWQHVFSPKTHLEFTLSYVGDYHTWGYKPVEQDGKLILSADEAGDEWIIFDDITDYRKYMFDGGWVDKLFMTAPGGGGPSNVLFEYGAYIRLYPPPYFYEDMETQKISGRLHFSTRPNPHHHLQAGLSYEYDTIDYHINQFTGMHGDQYSNYAIFPWKAGIFLQDVISCKGIQAVLGSRINAYQTGNRVMQDIFRPVISSENYILHGFRGGWTRNYSEKVAPVVSVSPHLAISHPLTPNSRLHYSWGYYSTPPDFTNLLYLYEEQYTKVFPTIQEQSLPPEKSIAWEMGFTFLPLPRFGINISTYYRDSQHTDLLDFVIQPLTGSMGSAYYRTDFGYRDNWGIEGTLWKKPDGKQLFGIVEISGTLSLEYAYERTAQDGSEMTSTAGIFQDNPWEELWERNIGTEDNFDFDRVDYWPTYSRSDNTYWNLKAALRCDFPWQLELSHIFTFRSPWRYEQQLNVENERYEQRLTGEYFLQWDLRAAKYFSYNRFGVKLYCDVLNVLNRENILAFDSMEKWNHYYEQKKGPWGPYDKATDTYGNLYTGIAREMYLGIELMLR